MKAHRCLIFILIFLAVQAAIAEETADQVKRVEPFKALRFGMFICWSFSTFSDTEWTPGIKDLSYFHPTGMDVDQWVSTARDAGMGYLLFLTKHHDGFCLWDTKTTSWKVPNSPLGRDVLAEVRRACDRHGLQLALYFSEGDWTWTGAKIPSEDSKEFVGGKNPELKKAQLEELLTGYGPIAFMWMDHAQGDGGLGHQETVAWIKRFQPGCFVGFNHGEVAGDLRLGEMGKPAPLDSAEGGGPYNRVVNEGFLAAEFARPILNQGGRWFYTHPDNEGACMPAEDIYRLYRDAVKYGNLFSLDVGPGRDGRLREIDVQTLHQVGEWIRQGK